MKKFRGMFLLLAVCGALQAMNPVETNQESYSKGLNGEPLVAVGSDVDEKVGCVRYFIKRFFGEHRYLPDESGEPKSEIATSSESEIATSEEVRDIGCFDRIMAFLCAGSRGLRGLDSNVWFWGHQ